MTCHHLHIGDACVDACSPSGVTWRRVRICPTCRTRRQFVQESWIWYPSNWTCTACGDTWSEDGRLPRPFRPRWREDARRRARAKWNAAPSRKQADEQFDALVRAEVILQ